MRNDESKFRIGNGNMVRFFALALPLVAAAIIASLSFQAAYAQLTPAQQQALKSLTTTGFTNHYPLKIGAPNPPPTFSIPYSIDRGEVITMAADQPRTSLDVILAPTQHESTPGVLTIQIPRHLLDSKNPDGTDKAFRVTLDGHGLAWQQLQSTNTDRVIGLYFTGGNGFLEIFGTTIASG
jgi:hypothetical protein